jgi:nucleotide-binding universal stress UspA family protein
MPATQVAPRWEPGQGVPITRAPALGLDRGLRELFVPTDLSSASDRAFAHASLLADRFQARVTLYHAVEAAPHADVPEQERQRRSAAAAREHLETQVQATSARSEVVVDPTSSPRCALLAELRVRRPDLVVMATHGREGVAHLIHGSVAETVVESGVWPVLCVREEHGAALPYRRLLVPTDLSEASRRALPLAGSLARAFRAEVLGLHVAALPSVGSLCGVPDLVERKVPSEADVKRFLARGLPGVWLSVSVEIGSPWPRILEVATRERADAIVLSSHGLDSLSDRLRGSHAERLVRRAPCPVLIV